MLTLATAVQAQVSPLMPGETALRNITCDYPVRLTHDCSIWRGATRPIALGDFRMSVAAGREGRVILMARVRPGPRHNGTRFQTPAAGQSDKAIRRLDEALAQHGISLERVQPVKRGRKVAAYLLEFSDNAYELLKQYTVLESEHWLPRQ